MFKKLSWILKNGALQKCKLLVLDVDGVLTDGSLIYERDNVLRKFCVLDGLGIKMLISKGVEVAFISGGKGETIHSRAKHLGVNHCYTEIINKFETLRDLQELLSIKKSETIYVGDDLNDLVVKPIVNLFIVPNNASQDLVGFSDCILRRKGGDGAVREICDRILEIKNEKYSSIKTTN